jgi:uncharacterized protein (TIGR02466 family)
MTQNFQFDTKLDDRSKIINLWPTPVYQTSMPRKLNFLEINFLNKQHKLHPLSENLRSDDSAILSNPELKDLSSFILQECQNYLKNVINPTEELEIYFTQSWLSFTSRNQSHHPHYHTNSFLSGVFYFDVEENIDAINFYNNSNSWNNRSMLHFDNSPTVWVSKRISVPVKNGDLVIFPSYLDHGVDSRTVNNHVRKSLAFNTWFSGKMGSEVALNLNHFR